MKPCEKCGAHIDEDSFFCDACRITRLIELNQETVNLTRQLRRAKQHLRSLISAVEDTVKANWEVWHERNPHFPFLPLYLQATGPNGVITLANDYYQSLIPHCELSEWEEGYFPLFQPVPEDFIQAIADFEEACDFIAAYLDAPDHINNAIVPPWFARLPLEQQALFQDDMRSLWVAGQIPEIKERLEQLAFA